MDECNAYDKTLADKLSKNLALTISIPIVRQLCTTIRKHRITDAIVEDNSVGQKVMKELLAAFKAVRDDERRIISEEIRNSVKTEKTTS